MKTFSVTFSLTLDVACADHLDIDWVAKQFAYKSDRFSTLCIAGDPEGGIAIQAASSGIESIRRYDSPRVSATPKSEAPAFLALTGNRFTAMLSNPAIRKMIGPRRWRHLGQAHGAGQPTV